MFTMICDQSKRGVSLEEIRIKKYGVIYYQLIQDKTKESELVEINANNVYNLFKQLDETNLADTLDICKALKVAYGSYIKNNKVSETGLTFEDSVYQFKKAYPEKANMINKCLDEMGVPRRILDDNMQPIQEEDIQEGSFVSEKIYIENVGYDSLTGRPTIDNIEINPQNVIDLVSVSIEKDLDDAKVVINTLSQEYIKKYYDSEQLHQSCNEIINNFITSISVSTNDIYGSTDLSRLASVISQTVKTNGANLETLSEMITIASEHMNKDALRNQLGKSFNQATATTLSEVESNSNAEQSGDVIPNKFTVELEDVAPQQETVEPITPTQQTPIVTGIIKTREEVWEDVKFAALNSTIKYMLSDKSRFKDIDPQIISAISDTFQLMSNDGGKKVKMSDGTEVRMQNFMRDVLYSRNKETLTSVASLNPEMVGIIQNFMIARKSLDREFLHGLDMHISVGQGDILGHLRDSVLGDNSKSNPYAVSVKQREFESEEEYHKNIEFLLQRTDYDHDTLYNMVGRNSIYYQSFDEMYGSIHAQMVNYQESTRSANAEQAKKHPLDRYKSLIEKYDITFEQTEQYPNGHFVVSDLLTGKIPQDMSSEEKRELAKDMTFVKSWVVAFEQNVNLSGKQNKFGYDEAVWQYAFSDGAKATFDKIMQVLSSNANSDISKDTIINGVSQNGEKQFVYNLMSSLLRERTNPYILDAVQERLVQEAGVKGVTIDKVMNDEGISLT